VRITFEDETKERRRLPARRGLADYLKKIIAERGAAPVHEAPFTLMRENDESGIRLDSRCSGRSPPTST
jgi:cytochrome P450